MFDVNKQTSQSWEAHSVRLIAFKSTTKRYVNCRKKLAQAQHRFSVNYR